MKGRDRASGPGDRSPGPDPETILEFLADPDCRRIVEQLDEPRTANEILNACDIPKSTVYRKLDAMTEARLLGESTVVNTHGVNVTRYYVELPDVEIRLDDDGSLSMSTSEAAIDPEPLLAGTQ